jgi:DNA mismatch repair protein MutL
MFYADGAVTDRCYAAWMDACAIQVLPDHVIDQIAAGEVVERPASVVKELVENALDAGARQVTVEIERGGRELIRVLDDGVGMSREEARMALVRHATSKLRALEDLTELDSMGFRGEALPSIAAVSRMVLTTRARGGERPGTRLAIDAGKVTADEEAGCPPGTQIEVRDLLYNLPARLKFMKGEATEAAHVTEAVARLAMAYPSVHFRVRSRGRLALEAPPHGDGFERARAVLGARLGEGMHRAVRQDGRIRVEVFLGAPETAQTTTRAMHIFVGRRWVRDRGLVHAVLQGYGELVPRGRYPAAALFVAVDGPDVDVNVHPQKLEVRFADAQAVYAAVRRTVREAVAQAPWLGAQVGVIYAAGSSAPASRVSEVAREYASSLSRSLFAYRRAEARPADGAGAAGMSPSPAPATAPPATPAIAIPSPAAMQPRLVPAPRLPVGDDVAAFFSSLRYLGQLDRTYLVCEQDGELVLVDQHAAHERVAFEKLRERRRSQTLPRQQLLFPQQVGLDRGQATAAREAQPVLEAIGFDIEPFGDAPGGGGAFAVKSVPAGLRGGEDPIALLVELIDELADQGASSAMDERIDSMLATLACHSVVRAGDEMAPAEVDALLTALDAIEFRSHCPHGRPVLLRIRVDEIARRFGRI